MRSSPVQACSSSESSGHLRPAASVGCGAVDVAEIGRDSKGNRVTRQERRVRWEPAAGVVDHAFDDEPVPGTHGLPLDLLRQGEPFPTREVVAYDTAFLSGHVVEHYRVVLLDAAEQSRHVR